MYTHTSIRTSNTALSGVIMVGKEGPYISASNIPTLAPICVKVKARFTATVDLPTPKRF